MQLGESFRVATRIRWIVAIHHGNIQPFLVVKIACKCTVNVLLLAPPFWVEKAINKGFCFIGLNFLELYILLIIKV